MKKLSTTSPDTPNTSPDKAAKVLDRFLDKLKESANGCLEYTGAKLASGYGIFHNPIIGKSQISHRYAYETYHGVTLAPDQYVRHLACNNPACSNPEHLALGTAKDNSADMVSQGRSTKGRTKSQKRFTEAEKQEIVRLSLAGISQYQIAKKFDRAESTIAQVLRRHKPAPKPSPAAEPIAITEAKKTRTKLTNCYDRLGQQLRREASRAQWARKAA